MQSLALSTDDGGVGATTASFLASLRRSTPCRMPYRHWLLQDSLPDAIIDAVTQLPIAPPNIDDTQGRRETHNDSRVHFGPGNRERHGVMTPLARAFQSAAVTRALEAETGAQLAGTSLRIEYCQDTDGFWLEPHTDIGVKKFTMLIYLNHEPEAADWGTDLYADHDTHVGRAPAGRNRGLIFVPHDNTWHGFERRPLNGVRKTLIINYVGPEWRNRHELCFPDHAID